MKFDQSQAIYKQIIDEFKKQIVRGELIRGDKMPSQREYAEIVRVNPNTVQRAYREMEMLGMVETLRGQGTYVTASQELQTQFKKEMADALLLLFITEMRKLGFQDDEMLETLQLKQKMQTLKEGEIN